MLNSRSLKEILGQIKEKDRVYFYWGKGASYLIPFINEIKSKKIVRFHGEWDLWEESSGDYAPLRNKVLQKTDLAVFISNKGREYFRKKYPQVNTESVVSYLGTSDYGLAQRNNKGKFHLLSCSAVIPLKRVELIYQSLQLITDKNIEWTHIGDGVKFDQLKQLVKSSHPNIKINLLGRIKNQEVISYYQNNRIDAFINVSSIEGVPVALMEAISFGVPVIGTDVGGTSEIVTDKTGILLSPDPTPEEVSGAVLGIMEISLNPKTLWSEKFSAANNYSRFAQKLIEIQ